MPTNAVYIENYRFHTPELAKRYMEQADIREENYAWQGSVFRRFITDHDPCLVIEYHYVDVAPHMLDAWFDMQMAAKDAMFAMPGTRKLGRTTVGTQTHTAGMLDYEDEDEEY